MTRQKRLLTDLAVIVALGACQIWGLSLAGTGSLFAGRLLQTLALVMAFAIGKSLGARRGMASL